MSSELEDIVPLVRGGERPAESVRALLRRFGFEKRGYHKVRHVRKSLDAAGLLTEPDFNSVALDALVTYWPVSKKKLIQETHKRLLIALGLDAT